MNKCHTPIGWVNDQTPAINDTNLNYMDGCIDTIDDRVITLDTTKAEQSNLLLAFKDVSLNSSTGVITFTLFNDTTKTIDTLLEKIAVNFDYDDDPTSAHYQNLIIELEDGTYKYIDMSALITQYEFTNSSTIAFTVGNDGSVSASVIDGSITGAKLQPNYLADVTAQASVASAAASASNANQLLSEGYANGTQGGVPVSTSSPYYHNNAKYWKEQAQAIAGSTLSGLSDVSITDPQDGESLVYNGTSQQWENKLIARIIAVPVPTVQTYTYTGSAQTFAWDILDTDATVITGDTQTNAGIYTVTVSLLHGNDVWDDNTTSPKTYTWTINKANASLSVNINSLSLNNATYSGTVAVTFTNDTGVSFTTTDSDIASPSPLTLNASGNVTISTAKKGSATVTVATNASTNYNAATPVTISVTSTYAALKTFAAATDEEIADMVAAADAGYIDLETDAGWAVGQEHSISLAAINSSGTYDGVSWSVGESQSAQTVTLVLMHKGLYELVTSVLDKQGQTRTTCSFVVGVKDCLDTAGYMNSTNTNSGSWNGSARRGWCNGGFREAIPSALRGAFKQFNCVTGDFIASSDSNVRKTGGTNITTQDYFALPAEQEIFGAQSSGTINEANALTQFTWYATSSNRVKNISSTPSSWFERSPGYYYNSTFCRAKENGTANNIEASQMNGISPFGCL